MIVDITVNGLARHLQARSDSLLPDCLAGRCGRCLVFMDGRLTYSCLVPAFKARGSVILSYEALASLPETQEIETAFSAMESPPCPFCRKAKALVLYGLLAKNPNPCETEIIEALSMVDCPCTDHYALIAAIARMAVGRNKRIYSRENK
ncbi:MAG: hypothetical protein NT061_05110 [Spirochaetes bacterium]|nr:hypothetical protein [Spirochaetota bacterium]